MTRWVGWRRRLRRWKNFTSQPDPIPSRRDIISRSGPAPHSDFFCQLCDLCSIWELEASRCVQKDVRGCANIFHYRKPHSENFTFSTIFEPPLPPAPRHLDSDIAVKIHEKCNISINLLILRCVYEGDLNVDCIFTGNSAPRQRDRIHIGTIAPALATP